MPILDRMFLSFLAFSCCNQPEMKTERMGLSCSAFSRSSFVIVVPPGESGALAFLRALASLVPYSAAMWRTWDPPAEWPVMPILVLST